MQLTKLIAKVHSVHLHEGIGFVTLRFAHPTKETLRLVGTPEAKEEEVHTYDHSLALPLEEAMLFADRARLGRRVTLTFEDA